MPIESGDQLQRELAKRAAELEATKEQRESGVKVDTTAAEAKGLSMTSKAEQDSPTKRGA